MSLWWVPVWQEHLPRRLWPNWVTMSKHFVFKILHEERIRSLPKEGSMPQKTIKGMVILPTDFFTIPSREGITVLENPMFIVWQRFLPISLINVLPRGFPLPGTMAACWTTALLEGYWFPEPSTPKDKPDNNCCWGPIRQ